MGKQKNARNLLRHQESFLIKCKAKKCSRSFLLRKDRLIVDKWNRFHQVDLPKPQEFFCITILDRSALLGFYFNC